METFGIYRVFGPRNVISDVQLIFDMAKWMIETMKICLALLRGFIFEHISYLVGNFCGSVKDISYSYSPGSISRIGAAQIISV